MQAGEDLGYSYSAIIEQTAPAIGISYKRDVADDCELRVLQDDPNSWDPGKLKAQALADGRIRQPSRECSSMPSEAMVRYLGQSG